MAGKLLRPKDVKERLGPIGINQVYALLKAGQIPSIQIGTRRLVPESALERWIEQNTKQAG